MSYKVEKQCKTCRHFWTKGIKNGKYDRWCCKYGREASKAIGHCKLNNGYAEKI